MHSLHLQSRFVVLFKFAKEFIFKTVAKFEF